MRDNCFKVGNIPVLVVQKYNKQTVCSLETSVHTLGYMDSQRLHHQNKNLPNTQGEKIVFNEGKNKEQTTNLILSPDI